MSDTDKANKFLDAAGARAKTEAEKNIEMFEDNPIEAIHFGSMLELLGRKYKTQGLDGAKLMIFLIWKLCEHENISHEDIEKETARFLKTYNP